MIKQKSQHRSRKKIEHSSIKYSESFKKKASELNTGIYRSQSMLLPQIEKIKKFLNSTAVKIVDIILTILLVVGFDSIPLFLSAEYDVIVSSLEIICMVYLLVELILKSFINERKFLFSVYFWIDLAAAFSLLLDIHWINNELIYLLTKEYNNYSKDQWQTINNFTQCIKVFTRSNRVLLQCRSIDWFKKKDEKKKAETNKVFESRFDNLIQKRILILALLMLIAMTMFNPKLYMKHNFSPIYLSLHNFKYFNHDDLLDEVFETYVRFFKDKTTPLFYLKAYGYEYDNQTVALKHLRPLEYVIIYSDCPDSNNQCKAIIDNRIEMKVYYIMNISQGIIVCIILVVGMFEFYRSIHELAIDPIRKMTLKIKNLSKNPVAALQENIELDNKNAKNKKSKEKLPIEIALLEKTVTKICGLLSLGFGEAGSDIISNVLKEGAETDMNPMISGKKIMAIYGFCDIRNFTDTTEVLQEKVMIFVNEVAEIVHEVTADFMGSANKNVGDAFLLVWKIEPKYTFKKGNELYLNNCFEVNQIVDMALIAFIKIIIKIRQSSKLAKYSLNKDLNKRIPNYRINLGFGLHLGYSIEGAIGSMFKIDASYLSPNVELAAAIQEKTKDYGSELILSKVFVDYLSKPAKENVRYLGIHEGDAIYTVDLDLSKIEIEKAKEASSSFEELNLTIENIKHKREKSKRRYRNISSFQMNVWNEYMKDKDMILVRQKYQKPTSAMHT